MGQILQNLQTLAHYSVALYPLDMGNETNSTGVVFVCRII